MSSSREAPPTPGTRHGSYILGDRLAAGGMAEVFTAESLDRHFETPIVIKRMLPHLANDRSFVTMFIDEARLSTRLDHPNIVKVYEFEATHRGLSLVMELVDGPDLLAVLKRVAKKREHVPAELAVYIICHVLEALDYAHSANDRDKPAAVIHRDVSPSNVLLTRRGRVKLADFGIARAAERQQETATGTLKGKYGYMSPEQILGHRLDGRSDLFSTAIVLTEMLTGRRLFAAASDLELLLMVRQADLKRYDKYGQHVPKGLDAIVRKALSRDPKLRYRNAGEFRDALSEWLATSDKRASAKHLSDFLAALEREGGDLCKWRKSSPPSTGSASISGPDTRLARMELRKAATAGRKVFALGGSMELAPPMPTLVEDLTLDPYESIDAEALNGPSRSGQWELIAGDLSVVHPIELLCEIGQERRTGLLVFKHGDLVKELYFTSGNPEFVRSNVMSDRFGQFLLRKGVLTENQLARVVATLPHFEGRMGQALVSLGLLRPVDAVRLLSEQIEHKIIDACRWSEGHYTFREGVNNPWPALALSLNTLHIVARALETVPMDRLQQWAKRHAHDRPVVRVDAIDGFLFDQRTARLMRVYVGKRSLSEILSALPRTVDRQRFLAASYVLARCEALDYVESTRNQPVPEPVPQRIDDVQTRPVPRTTERRPAPPPMKRARRRADDRRKFPRVETVQPAVIEMYRRVGSEPIDALICSVTCDGVGLRFDRGRFYRLREGERCRLRFNVGDTPLELEAEVAWCNGASGSDIDFGLALNLFLVPADMRDKYAAWSVGMITVDSD